MRSEESQRHPLDILEILRFTLNNIKCSYRIEISANPICSPSFTILVGFNEM